VAKRIEALGRDEAREAAGRRSLEKLSRTPEISREGLHRPPRAGDRSLSQLKERTEGFDAKYSERAKAISRLGEGMPAGRQGGGGMECFASEGPESATDRTARARFLRETDGKVLDKLIERHGQHIPAERIKAARETRTVFQEHGQYESGLRSRYPDLDGHLKPGERVLGDFDARENKPYVDWNQVGILTTTAHERLHQLSDPRFRETLGSRMDEGMSEYWAQDAFKEIKLKEIRRTPAGGIDVLDPPETYPRQRGVFQMLSARIGDEPLKRAYFAGDIDTLRRHVDADLGRGALSRLSDLVEAGRYGEAEELLKGRKGWP
jgi:hypothetical protein